MAGASEKMGKVPPAKYNVRTEWDPDASKWIAVVWTVAGTVEDSAIATHEHRVNAITNAFVMLAQTGH